MRRSMKRPSRSTACDVGCAGKVNSIHIMRTNIDIDDAMLEAAMRAGPFKTKKDAVEAGLKLLARQAAYREILKWEGKLHWDGDAVEAVSALRTGTASAARRVVANAPAAERAATKPRHGRR